MSDFSPSSSGEMSFLAGDGEMARRIRAFKWEGHPFGPPETWPQSLRSALSICLNAAFPKAIYWGPELRLLYNDAWAPIPGPRHPAALGAPAQEVWADIWPVIGPQFSELLRTGRGLAVENQMLPMRRFGAPEETYWNYSFTPIRGEDGAIAGVFNSGSETTRSVLSERQMRFLLEIGEELRRSVSPEAGRKAVIAELGAHLQIDRVGFGEMAGDRVVITHEWTAPGIAPIGGSVQLSAFGPYVGEELRAGRVLRINDAASDSRLDAAGIREAFKAIGVAAVAAVPWMEKGALGGVAFLHKSTPRAWNDFDIKTIEEVLERTRNWFERERSAERERIMIREIDHRARNVLAVAQSVVRLTLAEDITSFREKIEERIAALARAHTLLAAEHWLGVDLRTLVEQELAPYISGHAERVSFDGCPVSLPPELTQTVALVLHELATNAAKHGALGRPDGRLDVAWQLETGSALRLDWTESMPEGAGLDRRELRKGFGTTLLARVIETQLYGTMEQVFGQSGLRCRIAFPLGTGSRGAAPAAPASPERKAPRVMIVEDEAIIAMELEEMVESLGYAVFGVYGTLDAALAATETERPDLALLDANLRGASSLPLAERLRDAGVPLLLATGYDSVSGLDAGFAGIPKLTKPVSEKALAAALARAVPPS